MTPTLSRLSPLRQTPFWTQALAFYALFAIAGVADDYGATGDENTQSRIAHANLAYIATGATDALYYREHRYCGIAFEMPLLLAERALRLQDSRHIYLTRHPLTHPFFFRSGRLRLRHVAYRVVGSRWAALLDMWTPWQPTTCPHPSPLWTGWAYIALRMRV